MAFRKKFSNDMAVQGLLGGGSVMVRRMRAFVMANAIDRSGLSEVAPEGPLPGLS